MNDPDLKPADSKPAGRVVGVDAYRGFVMFLMMAEVLQLDRTSRALPESSWWSWLAFHQTHVAWGGCSLHDLIQPSFSFLVGVAVPFSIAARLAKGHSFSFLSMHAVWRAFLLVALGVFLRSMHHSQTYFTFEDTLSQIGLGYVPLFLLGFAAIGWRWAALVAIVAGYWLAFVLYPAPAAGFDYTTVAVPADWAHHGSGLAAHFNKNTNLAIGFDTWFLNLFPREEVYTPHPGGYATLSFIPTLGTMVLGLIAGGWLQASWSTSRKLLQLIAAGAVCLALGCICDASGICPSVKRIWTPSWVLFSGGWCFLLLAGFYAICDSAGWTAWSFPWRVIGANSIAAYVIAHVLEKFVVSTLQIHFGKDVFLSLGGGTFQWLVEGAAVLLVYWLILFWMYRRKIFLKI